MKTWPRPDEIRVLVQADTDVVTARRKGREFADMLGIGSVEATIVATVISQLARHILQDAGGGEIVVAAAEDTSRHAVVITARRDGQGLVGQSGRLAQRQLDLGTAGCWRWFTRLKRDGLEIVCDVERAAIVIAKGNP